MLKINSSNIKLITHDIYDIVDIFDNVNDGKDLLSANSCWLSANSCWGMTFNSTPEIMERIDRSMYEMCPITSHFMSWEYGEVRVCHTDTRSLASLPLIYVSIFNIAKYLPNYRLNRHYRGADQFLLIRIAMTSDAICEVSASIAKKSIVSLLFENHESHMKMEDEDFITLFDNIVKNNKSSYSPNMLAYELIKQDLAYSTIPIKFDKSKLY